MNFNSFNVVVSPKKGGLCVVFDILFQIWSKRRYLQHMPSAQTYWLADWLTGWLPNQVNKWMTEWINVSSMPFWFVTEVFFLRFPDCNVPTKDHIWWSSFYYHWKACLWFHQGTDRHAADMQRRKNAKVTNTWCFLLQF